MKEELTSQKIVEAEIKDNPYRIYDKTKKGFYVLVSRTAKTFRYQYRDAESKKIKTVTIGQYPSVSLAQARGHYQKLRALFKQNKINVDKIYQKLLPDNTFMFYANSWLESKKDSITPKTYKLNQQKISKYLVDIMDCDISIITAKQCYHLLLKIQDSGKICTAHKVKSLIGQIMRYAIIHGHCERDVTRDLDGALKIHVSKNFAHLSKPKDFGELIINIKNYPNKRIGADT